MTETDLLTAEEARKLLRISTSTFYRWSRDGKIPAVKMGGRTSPWKIKRADLDKALEDAAMARGYKAMSKENKEIAETTFEAQREIVTREN
jgi:excisionase family DNA binding protein